MKTISFLHSGDMGDIIASLPTVKELCEKEEAQAVLLLSVNHGLDNPDPKVLSAIKRQSNGRGTKFNQNGFLFLKPLLEVQPYISEVLVFQGQPVDYNLDKFRLGFFNSDIVMMTNQNLMFMHQVAFGLKPQYNGPWLEVQPSEKKHEIIISRTSRYQSAHIFFSNMERMFTDLGEFMGTDFEYDLYLNAFGYRPARLPITDALDAAKAIANSELLVTNGTVFYWIGVGLGHSRIIHEVGIDIPTTVFPGDKPHVRYVVGMKTRTTGKSKSQNIQEGK